MTKRTFLQIAFAVAIVVTLALQPVRVSTQDAPSLDAKVDGIFGKWNSSSPGCAVAVSVNGQPVLSKAYGMADLEHGVKNTAETIFEAGSVSKQFTAAAVLLLAREGKLSLDDPVRKYIPELPDYGAPLTIRHMLNHTSGLRDWGSVEGIAGWPRTSRVYTHAHVLEIVSKQSALNFTPGTRWSYSNTGYNLAAILVSRVSGMPFAQFTRQRLFEPLGMTHTSWRDDYTRIVKDRAIAYADDRDGFHTEMPFENVHGNGGLLTTVGDLLKWNENFATPKVGDAAFVQQQQQVGHFNDGRAHDYAFGLMVGEYKGLREVSHSGSTAGYRAFLTRYPDQKVSVAVLCNVGSGAATQYAHAAADLYLANSLKRTIPPTSSHTLTNEEIDVVVGLYQNTKTGLAMNITRNNDGLRAGSAALTPMSASRFVTANGQTWEIARGTARHTDQFGTVDTYERVMPAKPTTEQLKEFIGAYTSNDAETTLTAAIVGEALVLKRRPDTTIRLTPIYPDAFSGSIGTVIFRRDAAGRVTEFSVEQDRVWDLRFKKQPTQGQ